MSSSGNSGYLTPPANPHNDRYVDELNSVLESLTDQDERSVVLTLAAFADDTLELLLLNYLREPKQAKELLNGFNAPLGTFSAKVKVAFVLGLIREDHHKTLEIMRKVRNRFAHNWKGVSLDREDVADLIAQLPRSKLEEFGRSEEFNEGSSCREQLTQKCAEILADLRLLAKELEKNGRKAPLVMAETRPVIPRIREVSRFSDESE